MHEKLISIIIPAFNEEKRILSCLDSIFDSMCLVDDQLRKAIDVIVIDDGSTDSTSKVVSESRYNNDVQLHRIENRGLSGARNFGIEICINRTEYISLVDSDDLVDKQFIPLLLDAVLNQKSDIIEFSILQKKVTKSTFEHLAVGRADGRNHIIDDEYRLLLLNQGYWFAWARAYKSELFNSRRFSEGRYYEDSILIPLIYRDAKTVFSMKEPIYKYILRNGSITSTPKLKYLDDLIYSYELFIKEFNNQDILTLRKNRLANDLREVVSRMSLYDFLRGLKIINDFDEQHGKFSLYTLFVKNRAKFYIKKMFY